MNSMKRFRLFLLGVLALHLGMGSARAQYGTMTLNPDARSMSLGGVTSTTLSSSHTIYNNPSLVSFLQGSFHLGGSYYGENGRSYYAASGYLRFGGNALLAGWRQYDYGEGRDMSFELAYSRRIAQLFSVAITGRYMNYRTDLGEEADALVADLSGSCRIPLSMITEGTNFLVGLRLNNLGGYLKGDGAKLPVNLIIGGALDLWLNENHRMLFGADVGYYFAPSSLSGTQLSFGVEYEFMQLLQLRAGYHHGKKGSIVPSYGSIGAGIHILHLRFEAAYLIASKASPLHNAYSLNFGFDF